MPKKQPKSSISETVMQEIESGNVTMRPSTYYLLLTTLSVVTTIAAGIVIAYLTSILIFVIRISTADTMALGAHAKLNDALAGFPWWLLGVAILLGAGAVWLVRHQGRLYRHRISVIAAGIVVVSLLLGILFATFNIGQPYAERHTTNPVRAGYGQGRHINK